MPCSAATGSGVSELLDRYGISRLFLGFSDVQLTLLRLLSSRMELLLLFLTRSVLASSTASQSQV